MTAETKQTKRQTWAIVTGLSLAVLLTAAVCCWAEDTINIDIDVAPNVLNLQNQGEVVTVHTDLAYSSVVGSSVYLNGVEIDWWKVDNRGNFVAKFAMDDIQGLDGLIIGDYNALTLRGTTITGDTFSGTQDILVVDNVAAGKK
jgi:hypothetical protein